MFSQLAILAPGLLGASLAIAARSHGLASRIVTWARRVETRLEARGQPWCDEVHDTPEEAVRNSDIVVLCPPVHAILPLLKRIAKALPTGTIVTDVGSTKSLITRHGHALVPRGVHFVGSHPMAGSEKSGMAFARGDLFKDRACLVTPLPSTDDSALARVIALWKALDMHVASLSPEEHDEIVAHLSHLPHLLASALAAQLAQTPDGWRKFSGRGLFDTTRIAAGDPALWKAILLQNREEILRSLDEFEKSLQVFRAALANNDEFTLLDALERGRRFRKQLEAHFPPA